VFVPGGQFPEVNSKQQGQRAKPMGTARHLSRGKSWNSRLKAESREAVLGNGAVS